MGPKVSQSAAALALQAEELYDEGKWHKAVNLFELAAEAYVKATLQTNDTMSLQSLRLLAVSHTQRAHELRLRIRLHGLVAAGGADSGVDSLAGSCASSVEGSEAGRSTASMLPEVPAVSGAMARLGSQLISTLEALQFGAEELTRLELLLPAGAPGAGAVAGGGGSGMAASAIMGAKLIDSFCVVGTPRAAALGQPPNSPVVSRCPSAHGGAFISAGGAASSLCGSELARPGSAAGSAAGSYEAEPGSRMAALAADNGRLNRENVALRQRANEVHAVFVKAQRRAVDQQRLARKVGPRPGKALAPSPSRPDFSAEW